jgi:hypothetical protein
MFRANPIQHDGCRCPVPASGPRLLGDFIRGGSTGEHFRGGDVPRASAHVVAAFGLLSEIGRGLAALAEQHAFWFPGQDWRKPTEPTSDLGSPATGKSDYR